MADDDNFGVALEANWQVRLVHTNIMPETYDVCGVYSGLHQGAWTTSLLPIIGRSHIIGKQHHSMDHWTMQHGMRMVLHLTTSWHFYTNDRVLHYC
jgi:hypothetical protein